MASFSHGSVAGKGSGREAEKSAAVPSLSANAAAAVAAAIGHASLSRLGTATCAPGLSLSSATVCGDGSASVVRAASGSPAVAISCAGTEVGESRSNAGASQSKAPGSGTAAAGRHPMSSFQSDALAATAAAAAAESAAAPTTGACARSATAPHVTRAVPPMPSSSAARKDGGLYGEGLKTEPANSVDVLGRKVWDKSYYEARALSKEEDEDYLSFLPAPRQKKVAPPVEHRKPLQRRDFSIDLSKELGRTKIVTLQTPRMQQGGFWCDVCECLIKDSAAYLDHLNGRNHNRMLGMTMRVERAPPERVIGKLRELERQAQLELEGEDTLDNATGANSSGAGGAVAAAVGGGGATAAGGACLHVKSEGTLPASAGGAPAVAKKVKRPLHEENYDDIDRIKRRLEELQKQEEEKKFKKKLKKKRKQAGSGGGEYEENTRQARGVDNKQEEIKEEFEEEETEEQKLLKAIGLPSGFVGT